MTDTGIRTGLHRISELPATRAKMHAIYEMCAKLEAKLYTKWVNPFSFRRAPPQIPFCGAGFALHPDLLASPMEPAGSLAHGLSIHHPVIESWIRHWCHRPIKMANLIKAH